MGIGSKEEKQQAGTERFKSTFFGTMHNAIKKPEKNVQFRRICEGREGTEVRDQLQEKDTGRSRGYLLQVQWSFGTNRNPIFLAAKPKTKGQKMLGLGAEEAIEGVRIGE